MVKPGWTQLDLVFAAPAGATDTTRDSISKNSDKKASASRGDDAVREMTKHPEDLRTAGRYFDLKEVLERVSLRYFNGPMDVRIEWGRSPRQKRPKRRRSSSRALALYYFETNTIRVNPVLDEKNVPPFVLDWVVYHECLHHVLPVKSSSGRNIYHGRDFRALERAFDQYDEALAWEAAHINQLLR